MDEAYRSVVIGGDFVHNFALYAFGKPTPRTFFPEYLSAVLERLWRTLMIHPEFQELPPNTKLQVSLSPDLTKNLINFTKRISLS